jgi:two-component system, sensor histidine kinase PdtaS
VIWSSVGHLCTSKDRLAPELTLLARLRPSRQGNSLVAHLPLNPDGALSLALAVIESSASPILLLDADLRIIAASKSFCSAFGDDPLATQGCRIFDLAGGAWDVPQLHSLLAATLSDYVAPDAYEMDLVSPGRDSRRLVLNAKKLDYVDADNIRLLVSVWDITDARDMVRRRDQVVREKAVLL